jgi:hypothetical protein
MSAKEGSSLSIGAELRTPPPRSTEICNRVVGKHGAWWGFAVYGIAYAMSVMAIGLAFAAPMVAWVIAKVRGTTPDQLSTTWWVVSAIIGGLASAPITSIPFVRWVKRRRGALADVARDGAITSAQIVSYTHVTLNRGDYFMKLDLRATVGGQTRSFSAIVPKAPEWVTGGSADLVARENARYAILLAPDGGDFIAKRK